MLNLNNISFADVPVLNRLLRTDKKEELLSQFMDESLLDALGEDLKAGIYLIARNLLDKAISDCIAANTGEKRIPDGTKVRLLKQFSADIPAGITAVVIGSIRFEDDTFGQGLYTYELKTEHAERPILAYRHELEIIPAEKTL